MAIKLMNLCDGCDFQQEHLTGQQSEVQETAVTLRSKLTQTRELMKADLCETCRTSLGEELERTVSAFLGKKK